MYADPVTLSSAGRNPNPDHLCGTGPAVIQRLIATALETCHSVCGHNSLNAFILQLEPIVLTNLLHYLILLDPSYCVPYKLYLACILPCLALFVRIVLGWSHLAVVSTSITKYTHHPAYVIEEGRGRLPQVNPFFAKPCSTQIRPQRAEWIVYASKHDEWNDELTKCFHFQDVVWVGGRDTSSTDGEVTTLHWEDSM
ncbi:hypothetical protein E2C01_064992 [Portunus trituberculatus]|uniref:Uncharacterized protein n=1 Tax=Portunus trituberculatus TaxID=210409 RepID=A0A5B7HLC4_PORTR|nr:hypothetical protein [Portunus trituberculatus]